MAYNNYNSGKSKFKEIDKNTSSFRLKNATAAFPSTMALGFWNSTMTLKLHPALPEGQRSNEKLWDYNTFSMSVLNAEKAIILLDAIEENMSDMRAGDFEPFGISSGAAFVEISPYPGMEGIDDSGLFLNLYNKIDEKGEPGETISYKFNTNQYFKNYKNKGKSMERCDTKLPSEFLLFLTFLKEGIKGLSCGTAHGLRNANKYEYSRAVNDRHRMMEKLGLSLNDFKSNAGGNSNQGGSFFQGNSGAASNNADGEFNYSVDYGQLQGDRIDLED